MGMTHKEYLSSTRVFGCSACKTHLTTIDSLISKAFNGQHGRAYLFDKVVNVTLGEPDDRNMTTGLYTVRDIYCIKCEATLGWKYDKAYVAAEKYKEGKFILEKELTSDVK
ncbi:yippee-like protein [Violaceomyces palustris]|uniref:Yippee-like protein n=1 Tax=Violaceomyces palustris TaxID=1673888 RepID=A0ACD0P7M0_9BASI|nr:yippee-like protein [Violaceomyces palustris]